MIWRRLYLWWHGYCTKHLVQKEMRCYSPEDIYSECDECEAEREARRTERIARYLAAERQEGK